MKRIATYMLTASLVYVCMCRHAHCTYTTRRHMTEDIPSIARAAGERTGLDVVIADPIGLHPLVADILMDRVRARIDAVDADAAPVVAD